MQNQADADQLVEGIDRAIAAAGEQSVADFRTRSETPQDWRSSIGGLTNTIADWIYVTTADDVHNVP